MLQPQPKNIEIEKKKQNLVAIICRCAEYSNKDVKHKWKTMSCIVCLFIITVLVAVDVFPLPHLFLSKNARVPNQITSKCTAARILFAHAAHCVAVIHFLFVYFFKFFSLFPPIVYLSSQWLSCVYVFCCYLLKLWSQHVIVIWSINRPLNKHSRLHEELALKK